MKRILVVLAVVMALTLAVGATSVGAQGPMGGLPMGGPQMGGSQKGMPPMGGVWYVVRPGDTLSAIALKYGVSFWEIARANGIWNPDLIFVGQMLFIPVRRPGPFPGPFPGAYPGMFPGYGGGYASWASGGSMGWGTYPYFPYWGGSYPYQMPQQMPQQMPLLMNDGGNWGNPMPMGGMGGGMPMGVNF